MKNKKFISILFMTFICANIFAQSKMEMQNFIAQDLKRYAGTWIDTMNGKIFQQATNYSFTVQNCDLIITCRYTSDGVIWGDSKIIIPIADINEVNLIPKKTTDSETNSTRLQIMTSGHTMKMFWNGKLINMGNNEIIGLDRWTSDLAEKYKSVFREFSKFCN